MIWRTPVFELDPNDPDNNGFINEDFIVWMRTAALPTFRKLYRIIQKKADAPTLASGRYVLEVSYSILLLPTDGVFSASSFSAIILHCFQRKNKLLFV